MGFVGTGLIMSVYFPVQYGVTAILGVTASGLKIGAYFTYDPVNNGASEWSFFTLQNGQFSPLRYPVGSWTYPLDVNKWDDVLLAFDKQTRWL